MWGVPMRITVTSMLTGSGFSASGGSEPAPEAWNSRTRFRRVRLRAGHTPASARTSMASRIRKPPLARRMLPVLIRVWSVCHSPLGSRVRSIVPNRFRNDGAVSQITGRPTARGGGSRSSAVSRQLDW